MLSNSKCKDTRFLEFEVSDARKLSGEPIRNVDELMKIFRWARRTAFLNPFYLAKYIWLRLHGVKVPNPLIFIDKDPDNSLINSTKMQEKICVEMTLRQYASMTLILNENDRYLEAIEKAYSMIYRKATRDEKKECSQILTELMLLYDRVGNINPNYDDIKADNIIEKEKKHKKNGSK